LIDTIISSTALKQFIINDVVIILESFPFSTSSLSLAILIFIGIKILSSWASTISWRQVLNDVVAGSTTLFFFRLGQQFWIEQAVLKSEL